MSDKTVLNITEDSRVDSLTPGYACLTKERSFQKRVREGCIIPSFYGVAWDEWHKREAVCFPIPLNLIFAFFRAVWIWMRHGWKTCPFNPRDAYAQGYRDGRKA